MARRVFNSGWQSGKRAALLAAAWIGANAAGVEILGVHVHETIPHDTEAFTQGLLWWQGKLYESTGRYGHSEVRRLDPATGAVEMRARIPMMLFGEGLARTGERLVMLTWRAGQALSFGIRDFDRLGMATYRGEGWGLCHDGTRFVMSDGSHRLAFRDSATFARTGDVAVTLDGRPLPRLNELECVADSVYANVWGQDVIVRIDPDSGRVRQRIDAAGLLDAAAARRADVLNGIAYDPESGRFYITGKLWPKMFAVTFEAKP